MKEVIVGKNINHLNEDIASITKKAEMARAQVASEICADIRKMVNNADYSDVVFVCQDGARIHASRLFLVARSAVLHRMLLNGMAESQLSEITLQEISSTALLPVMEFLYTGTLHEHAPKDWRNAYEIISAARFFLLEGLELIAMDYLVLAAAELGVDLGAAAKFLCIAVEFVGVFGETVDLIARNLVCILESTSNFLKPEHLQALTDKAFRYFLDHSGQTRHKIVDPDLLLKAEFLRLKNLILWCACKEFAPNEPLTVHAIPPEIASTLELLEKSPFKPCHQLEIYNGIKPALALSVEPYLPLVNFQKISPYLLSHIIEPMDIIPSSTLMDAFRFHALRASSDTVDTLRWSTNCKNDETYRMSRDGSVIQKMASDIGFASYGLQIHNCGRGKNYRWEIIIEEVCESFIEIGLFHDLDGDQGCSQDGHSLSGQPGGWALRMDSRGLSINRTGKHHRAHHGDPSFVRFGRDCGQLVYGQDYGHKNSKVKICFEDDNTCGLKVKTDKFGDLASSEQSGDSEQFGNLAWYNFPQGTLYPAVSLGSGSSGRVRIRILQVN